MVPNLISEGDTKNALLAGSIFCKNSGGLASWTLIKGYASHSGFYPKKHNEISGLTSGGEGNRTTAD